MHLIAAQQLRKRLRIIQAFRFLKQSCNNNGVILIAVQQFKLSVWLVIPLAHHFLVKDGAIDSFAVVIAVNKPLIGIHHLNQIVSLVALVADGYGASAIHLAFYALDVYALVFLNYVLHPISIPPIRSHLVQQFLRGVECAPEAIGGTLGVCNVRREEEVAIRGEGLHQWAIHLTLYNWNLSLASFTQLLEGAFGSLVIDARKGLLEKLYKHLVCAAI